MDKKYIKVVDLNTKDDTLMYWLSKTVSERIEAVEQLRGQHNEPTERLQRVIRVIQQK